MLFFCSRVGVVKAASYAASWTLSKASQETYWKLYHVSIEQIFSRYSIFIMFIVTDLTDSWQAINAGSMGADCEKSYPNTNCVLRDRIFSHNEL